MKFDWLKSKHHLFDLAIGILLVAIIILVDLFFVKMKSNPGEEIQESITSKNPETVVADSEKYRQLESGQKVFVPILNFHHLGTAPAKLSKVAKSFYIDPKVFEQILNDLIKNDYRPVFVSEIVKDLQNKKLPQENMVAITFDDGDEDFYTTAWPILQKLKIKSSLYIMTGVKGADWVTPEQIQELDKSGLVEIGSHTVYHPYLTKLKPEEQAKELLDSKLFLEKLLNKDVTVICYPFGLYNDEIKALAKSIGYQAGLTFDQDAWQNPDDLMGLTRISVYPGLEVMKFLEKLEKG